MAIPITIPRLGWNMEEGVFVGWLKADGAAVRIGESLFTLESEKATEDVECLDAGTLRIPPNGPKAGDKLAVGAVIGYLLAVGEKAPFENAAAPAARMKTPAPVASPSVRELAREQGVDLAEISGSGSGGRILAEDVVRSEPKEPSISPRALRLARQLGIDWTRLTGSGRNRRIRECDIRAVTPAPIEPMIAVSGTRRTIAARMLESHQSTAPVTLTTTADASNLVNLRNQFKAVAAADVPSYSDFLVKLTALALLKHPEINSSWSDEGITKQPGVHIGLAVDTEAGLLVPVLRDVPSLGLKQLAARSRELVERARQRGLSAEQMQGGTFTVTNLGSFGIETFTPIINYPQCAILGIGRIQRKPVVVGEQIVPREQLSLSLTFDHRIVDGAPAARFLQTLTALIENPGPGLMT